MEAWTLVSGGRAVRTARYLDVMNPSTGAVVGRAPIASAADLDDAVAAAKQAFSAWRDTPDAERAEACRRIAVEIANNSEGLARLLTEEQGKPLNGLGSRFEIGGAVAWARQ